MAYTNLMLKKVSTNENILIDSFGRTINYLRISVTDRCNQQCIYCSPKGVFTKLPREDVVSFEEIYDFTNRAVSSGITKVKLTGGEPLVRRDVIYLVELLASIQDINDFGMTTNGILLKKFSKQLKNAGLQRINISLDTLRADKYSLITKGGTINEVYEDIEAAQNAGLEPVKINCVVMPGINENEIDAMRKFCENAGLHLQFIHVMDLNQKTLSENLHRIFSRPPKCELCNKLRLASNGDIFPCLYSNLYTSIRKSNSYLEALIKAVAIKPFTSNKSNFQTMAEIGG